MSQAANKKKKRLGREELTLNLMILPGMIILIIFVFAPLVGSLMAFENYVPAKGLLKSKWVGLMQFSVHLQPARQQTGFHEYINHCILKAGC